MTLIIIVCVVFIALVIASVWAWNYDELDEYDDFECIVEPKKGKR